MHAYHAGEEEYHKVDAGVRGLIAKNVHFWPVFQCSHLLSTIFAAGKVLPKEILF